VPDDGWVQPTHLAILILILILIFNFQLLWLHKGIIVNTAALRMKWIGISETLQLHRVDIYFDDSTWYDMSMKVGNYLNVVDLKYLWGDGKKLKNNKKTCHMTALFTLWLGNQITSILIICKFWSFNISGYS
jgi:hypothetical protein